MTTSEPNRAAEPETMRERAEREMGRPLDQEEYTAWLERGALKTPLFAPSHPTCPTSLTGHPNGCRCR